MSDRCAGTPTIIGHRTVMDADRRAWAARLARAAAKNREIFGGTLGEAEDPKGHWVTIRGRHVFIRGPQPLLTSPDQEGWYDEERYRRGKKGTGEEIEPGTRDELEYILNNTVFGIVSAGRNGDDPKEDALTDADIDARHEGLRQALIDGGFKYTEVVGKYGSVEKSFMVMAHGIKKRELVELGARFNQQSVVYVDHGRNQLIYTTTMTTKTGDLLKAWTGTAPVVGYEWLSDEEPDAWSDVPLSKDKKRKKARFRLDLDFDHIGPVPKATGIKEDHWITLRDGRHIFIDDPPKGPDPPGPNTTTKYRDVDADQSGLFGFGDDAELTQATRVKRARKVKDEEPPTEDPYALPITKRGEPGYFNPGDAGGIQNPPGMGPTMLDRVADREFSSQERKGARGWDTYAYEMNLYRREKKVGPSYHGGTTDLSEENLKEMCAGLRTAINRSEIAEGITLYRGQGSRPGKVLAEKGIGGIYWDPGFQNLSTDFGIAKGYMSAIKDPPPGEVPYQVMMRTVSKKGIPTMHRGRVGLSDVLMTDEIGWKVLRKTVVNFGFHYDGSASPKPMRTIIVDVEPVHVNPDVMRQRRLKL